jgi:hypothetical protein
LKFTTPIRKSLSFPGKKGCTHSACSLFVGQGVGGVALVLYERALGFARSADFHSGSGS